MHYESRSETSRSNHKEKATESLRREQTPTRREANPTLSRMIYESGYREAGCRFSGIDLI